MSDLAERAAIVAWLRSQAPELSALIEVPDSGYPGGWGTDEYGEPEWIPSRSNLKRLPNRLDYADAIERGDHLVSTPTCRICGHTTDSKIHEWCQQKEPLK